MKKTNDILVIQPKKKKRKIVIISISVVLTVLVIALAVFISNKLRNQRLEDKLETTGYKNIMELLDSMETYIEKINTLSSKNKISSEELIELNKTYSNLGQCFSSILNEWRDHGKYISEKTLKKIRDSVDERFNDEEILILKKAIQGLENEKKERIKDILGIE